MKKLLIFLPLITLSVLAKSQAPFYGDRLFISADKQDSMWLRFTGDTVYFIGDNGFFKFGKAIMVDSIRLKDGKWHKSIVTVETDPIYNAEKSQYLKTETDPVYNAEKSQYLKTESDPQYYSEKSTILLKADSSLIYGTRYMVGRSIKDSLANLKTKFPVLTFKPSRDSLNYEMTGYGKVYKIPVSYSIFRPSGAGTITSVKIDSKVITIPALSEGSTYTGTDTITFAGPDCPTCVTSFSKTYNLKVAAGRDTISQPLILNQYWRVYLLPLSSIYTGWDGVQMIYDADFMNVGTKSELLINGQAFIKNISPAGQQLVLGIPIDFASRTIYLNGLPAKLIQYPTYNNNFANKRNAAHKYIGLITTSKIKGVIQTIEIR